MRTIKFRGKRIDNGEWVYGFYTKDQHNNSYIVDINGNSENETFPFYIVEENTVGEFIGLPDKNGKEIYEGDILKSVFTKLDGTKIEIIGIVEKDKYNPCFVIHYKFNGNGHDCYEYDFIQCGIRKNEVIGNIHENPELLK